VLESAEHRDVLARADEHERARIYVKGLFVAEEPNFLFSTTSPSYAAGRLHDELAWRDVALHACRVLTAPTRLVIDDMPGVADALRLGASILERKEGIWRAFEAAGVQNLSAAIRIEVVNRDPAGHQGTVAARISERNPRSPE